MSNMAPIELSERIHVLDVIRGFALFGVLLMNLVMQSFWLAPWGAFDDLPTARIDALIVPGVFILVGGKAMTLFSLLFGYGFAMMISRLEDREAHGDHVLLRRLAILFIIGILHMFLLWFGDILCFYAAMGFVLLIARKWSDRTLLICGLILALLSMPITEYILTLLVGKPYPWWEVAQEGAARRFELFQGNDYSDYVAENWQMTWSEVWGNPQLMTYLWPTTLGRFMLGAWMFRQGWFNNLSQHAIQFRRYGAFLVSCGLVISYLAYKSKSPYGALGPLSELLLGLGYGSAIVAVYGTNALRRLSSGFAAVGRMALTSYLMQSLVYVFVLYGFGLGLLKVLGGTACVIIAVMTFGAQISFSQWWLGRYQFGPVEWLWRSLTYAKMQPIRILSTT